jgi:hypothetical protein
MRYQQDLRVNLRDRLRRLMVANWEDAGQEVRLVTDWIAGQPALRAILTEAELAEPGLDHDSLVAALQGTGGLARHFRWPSEKEAGRADLVWHLMRRISDDDRTGIGGDQIVISYTRSISSGPELAEMWREFAERILRPLFDYLDERIGAEGSVLYTLERYVRRLEWFDRDELYERAMADTRNAEEVYDADLRRFLFGEGINMPFSQAKSASGLSDVLSDLDTDDPLVCEVKIFDGSGRGKSYLAKGVNQVAGYASDHSKQVAYLVIINLSGRPLSFPDAENSRTWPPHIDVADVRVYLIVVRALPTVSASKQGKATPVKISHDDLVNPDSVG